MGGLLTRAIGGAMQGAGAAMVDQAKAAREDALAALKRAGEVQDRDVNIAATAANVATQQKGETERSTANNQTSANNALLESETSQKNTKANNDTSRANNADTEKGANSRNAATIAGQKDIAKMRTDSYNAKTASIASQYGTNKALTYNQALQTARQAYKDQVAQGGSLTDADGTAVPADKAISDIADQLMKKGQASQPTQTTAFAPSTGGGLTTNLFNTNPQPLSFPSPGSTVAPPPSPPAAAPPQAAVDMLRKNPSLQSDFDQKYGQGAAARALGQ